MQRDPNLIPLSHQHQHALALCVRIERTEFTDAAVTGFCSEIDQMWHSELQFHFAAEEEILFPEAVRNPALSTLVEELIEEHRQIRSVAGLSREQKLTSDIVRDFARLLAAHVRKEERQLFEQLQQHLTPQQLSEIGTRLWAALRPSSPQS